MKKIIIILVVLGVVGIALILAQPQPPPTAKNLTIGTTIFPLYDIARTIGGEEVDVINILPPGGSPHTFEPLPSTIKSLQNARVIFAAGYGLDDWVNDIAASIPEQEVLVVDKNITLKKSPEEGADEHTSGNGFDPHYWLDINNAPIIAQTIADTFIALDNEHEALYRERLSLFEQSIRALERELSRTLLPYSGKEIIVLHDGWFYFADAFDLSIAGVFEPSPGKEPTPRYLETLQRTAQDRRIRAVFSEPQLSNETLKPIIKDLGLDLNVLDPLGGVSGRTSYIELMRYNVNVIAHTLNE